MKAVGLFRAVAAKLGIAGEVIGKTKGGIVATVATGEVEIAIAP